MSLLIDNYGSFSYNLDQMIAEQGCQVQVARNDQLSIESIRALNPQGIVLSPGPGRPEQAGICMDVVQAFAGHCPILGVCLGMQAIALSYGAKVTASPQLVHGKQSMVFHDGRYQSLAVSHLDLSDALMIQALSSDATIMALRHRDYPIFGLQFHPESILTPCGGHCLKRFIDYCGGADEH